MRFTILTRLAVWRGPNRSKKARARRLNQIISLVLTQRYSRRCHEFMIISVSIFSMLINEAISIYIWITLAVAGSFSLFHLVFWITISFSAPHGICILNLKLKIQHRATHWMAIVSIPDLAYSQRLSLPWLWENYRLSAISVELRIALAYFPSLLPVSNVRIDLLDEGIIRTWFRCLNTLYFTIKNHLLSFFFFIKNN